MKKGNLSNVPAPYIYVDAESLFMRAGIFSDSPIGEYRSKLVQLIKHVNVGVVLDKNGRITKTDIEKSPFVYTMIFRYSRKDLVKFLRHEKAVILVSEQREKEFSWSNLAVSINNSAESILAGLGV
jgi:hypothetical protein